MYELRRRSLDTYTESGMTEPLEVVVGEVFHHPLALRVICVEERVDVVGGEVYLLHEAVLNAVVGVVGRDGLQHRLVLYVK